MAIVEKSVLVLFSAEQMFDLVQDVPAYPKFLPWCGGAYIAREQDGFMEASVEIAFKGVRQSFTTHNTHVRPASIEMNLKEGPFQSMQGRWEFLSLREDACKVQFKLDYEFSNRVLEQLIGPVFHTIANSFVDSFIKRAEIVYAVGG